MANFGYKKTLKDYLDEYNAAAENLKQYQAQNNPGQYQSQYASQLADMRGRIANRQPFSYNPYNDMLYQQYRTQQMNLGKSAMQDTLGQAAQLTGGYANSYANIAAQQQYNQFAQRAAEKMADYADLAYNRYAQEGQDLYNLLAMYQSADDTDYGRYRDRVGDYNAMVDYLTGRADTAYNRGADRYNTDYSNAYNMWRAQTADEQAAAQMAFQREQYEYEKQQDALNYALKLAQASGGGSGGGGNGGGSGNGAAKKGFEDTTKRNGTTGKKTLSNEDKKQLRINFKGEYTRDDLAEVMQSYLDRGYSEQDLREFFEPYLKKAK